MKNNEKIDVNLSIIDVERKYSIPEYEEKTYSADSPVSYGADNALPTLFYNCYKGSATLKSVIDGYVNYILGNDLLLSDKAREFEAVNGRGETMREFVAKLALDYMVYGGFAFQIIRNKMGLLHSLIPLDFARCRRNESGKKIFYSAKNWGKYTSKYQEYEAFNPYKTQDTAIFYFKGDFSKNVYPLPLWYGALYDVLTEIECSKYSLNTVSNGFSARYVINLPNSANLTKEQKDEIEKRMREKFSGNETDSNFMLYFAASDKNLTVSKIDSDDLAERYTTLKDNARSNIYTSLRATPLLFGLPNASNGFSTQEYSDSFKLFSKSCIKPIQDIFSETMGKIFKEKDALHFEPFRIDFEEQN